MQTIVDYTIVEEHDKDTLEMRVQNMLPIGWQPIGGVALLFTTSYDDGAKILYTQALVRYAE